MGEIRRPETICVCEFSSQSLLGRLRLISRVQKIRKLADSGMNDHFLHDFL